IQKRLGNFIMIKERKNCKDCFRRRILDENNLCRTCKGQIEFNKEYQAGKYKQT
ncbi:hypothetical protein LCGC14_2877170, partial [marine sediment metagenome]